MIKVRLLNNPHQEYCKYRYNAYEAFNGYAEHNAKKIKEYKNGNRDYWFSKTAYQCGKYLVSNMRVESIALEVTGK